MEHHSRMQIWQHPRPSLSLGLERRMLRHHLEGNHPRIRSCIPRLRLFFLLREPRLGHTPT